MVQYWDEEENEVRTRYLGSTSLGHSTAVDLMDKLNEVIKHPDPEKLYQISMDGPAGNVKFLNEFKLEREENDFHSKLILEPVVYILCTDLLKLHLIKPI